MLALDFEKQIHSLEKKIEELEKALSIRNEKTDDEIPTYSFSKIRDKELDELIDIKEIFNNNSIFNKWFNNSILLNYRLQVFQTIAANVNIFIDFNFK